MPAQQRHQVAAQATGGGIGVRGRGGGEPQQATQFAKRWTPPTTGDGAKIGTQAYLAALMVGQPDAEYALHSAAWLAREARKGRVAVMHDRMGVRPEPDSTLFSMEVHDATYTAHRGPKQGS